MTERPGRGAVVLTVDSPMRGRLLARNTLWNLAGFGIPLVAAAAAIPPTIAGLGADRFGILTLGWVVLGYFHLFDLGLSRATTRLVASALAGKADGKLGDYLWAAAAMQAVFGLAGGAILAVATPFLIERALSIPPELVAEARTSFFILAASVPFVLVTGSFQGALAGGQRFDLVNAVRVPFSTANYVLPLVGLAIGWSLVGIVALLFASRLAALAIHLWQCLGVFPGARGPRTQVARAGRELLGFGAWVTVSSAVGPVLMYLDRFMLGAYVSVGAVGYYAAASELVTRFMIIPGALAATLFPALSAATGSEREAAAVVMARSLKYLVMSSGLVSLGFFVFAPDILRIWLGSESADHAWVLRVLALGVLVNAFAHVPYTSLHARGRPDTPAKLHLVELPCHLVAAYGLVHAWGIVGAAVAWSARALFDAALLFAANTRVSPVSVSAMRAARLPQAAGVLLAFASILIAMDQTDIQTAGRVLLASAGLLLTIGALVRFGLDSTERAFFGGWIRAALGSR